MDPLSFSVHRIEDQAAQCQRERHPQGSATPPRRQRKASLGTLVPP
jgi:hypothetical protein